MIVTTQVHDGKRLLESIVDIIIKQDKIVYFTIADGAYDNNNNFQYLSFRGIPLAIRVRKIA